MVRGAPQNRVTGASEDLPRQKWEAEKVVAMLNGGTKSFLVILTQKLEVLSILKGCKKFLFFKKGDMKLLPCLERACVCVGGGVQNFSDQQFSYFVVPPPSL